VPQLACLEQFHLQISSVFAQIFEVPVEFVELVLRNESALELLDLLKQFDDLAVLLKQKVVACVVVLLQRVVVS
jgi:hypothetical protein